jgi:hypothetical protein
VFPILLDGWAQFGPIGVSMTIMTWVGVIGVAWVVTACASAIVWERNAPATIVIEAQNDARSNDARSNDARSNDARSNEGEHE